MIDTTKPGGGLDRVMFWIWIIAEKILIFDYFI